MNKNKLNQECKNINEFVQHPVYILMSLSFIVFVSLVIVPDNKVIGIVLVLSQLPNLYNYFKKLFTKW